MASSLSIVAVVMDPLLLYLRSLLKREVIFLRPSPGKKSFIIIKSQRSNIAHFLSASAPYLKY